jgi:hypothetical protein
MFPFGVTIPATVPQGSEIPEGLMNNRVHIVAQTCSQIRTCYELLTHLWQTTYKIIRLYASDLKINKSPLRKHYSDQNQDWITKIRKAYSNITIYFKHSKDKVFEKVKPSIGQAKNRTEINISLLNHQNKSS